MMSLAMFSVEPIFLVMKTLVSCLGALMLAGPSAHRETWKTAIGGAVGAGLGCFAVTYFL